MLKRCLNFQAVGCFLYFYDLYLIIYPVTSNNEPSVLEYFSFHCTGTTEELIKESVHFNTQSPEKRKLLYPQPILVTFLF